SKQNVGRAILDNPARVTFGPACFVRCRKASLQRSRECCNYFRNNADRRKPESMTIGRVASARMSLRRLGVALLAAVIAVTTLIGSPAEVAAQRARIAPEPGTGQSEKQLARARSYMVSAANPLAVKAGRRVLQEGGSAADAAIAPQLRLN